MYRYGIHSLNEVRRDRKPKKKKKLSINQFTQAKKKKEAKKLEAEPALRSSSLVL